MLNEVFHTVLLLALPASGKSELRNFMANMGADRLERELHIGENLQLDDFPYVHMMRRIDEELVKLGEERVFYPSNDEPFYSSLDWGTLIRLLNEDYNDMLGRVKVSPDSAASYLFERIDRAAETAGLPPRMGLLDENIREKLSAALEKEAAEMLSDKQAQYPESFDGKTIIIECARGGPDGSTMPLEGSYGYQYSLAQLCPDILKNAAIMYLWVTPEESRRKNNERANPDDPGSNLFHGVPIKVMLGDYGCDDMEYLIGISEKEGTITVDAYGKKWFLPIGVVDNRVDMTSFLRADKADWDPDKIETITAALREAAEAMWKNYKK